METPSPDRDEREVELERQLQCLLGQNLFGEGLEPSIYVPGQTTAHRRLSRNAKRLLGLLALALALPAVWLFREGVSKRELAGQEKTADDLRTFLQDGDLPRVAALLPVLEQGAPLSPDNPYFPLVLRAEATLYRYHDADPTRRIRLEQAFRLVPNAAASSLDQALAALIVLSRPERSDRLDELRGLAGSAPRDPQCAFLLAAVLDDQGDHPGARRAYTRAEELGPLWLPHRLEQILFERRTGNPRAVAKLVQKISRQDPGNPWTALARQWAGAPSNESLPAPKPLPLAIHSPVERFYEHLLQGARSARAGDEEQLAAALKRAAEAVFGQDVFLLDAFALLLAEDLPRAVRALMAMPGWPQGSKAALALEARLLARERAVEPAAPTPRSAAEEKSAEKKKLRKKPKKRPRRPR